MGTILLISAALIVAFMTAAWLFSLYKRDMSVVDGFWGLGFVAVTHHWFFRLEEITPRQFIIAYLITLWGLRLAIYIFYRSRGKAEDPRYVAFRNNWKENTWYISYFKVFMLQGFLTLVIVLPSLFVMYDGSGKISLINIIGIALWTIGWIFETAADYQMLQFKKNPANKGKVMDKGLWYYSRHPNYFGEVCVWWGIFLISINGISLSLIGILSPILITYMLLKVSGITMLEQRYEGNDAYSIYKRTTSPFFPLPKRRE
jgi:steroid 5-alpha reductase family enzyme